MTDSGNNHRYAPAMNGPLKGILVEPLDTLFFRDGRPFEPADRGRGGLPTPQTFAGMIKTHLLNAFGIDKKAIHGNRNNGDFSHPWFFKIAVRGPWLARTNKNRDAIEELYFRAPANLMKIPGESEKLILLNPLSENIDLPGWSPPIDDYKEMRPLLYLGKEEKIESARGFVTCKGMKNILNNEVPGKCDWISPDKISEKLYALEHRTGIGINYTSQTTQKGLIYSARHIRLRENIVFYGEIGWEKEYEHSEDKDDLLKNAFPKDGVILPFGGEGRRVLVKGVNKKDFPADDREIPPYEEGGYVTYLISPVIFHSKNNENHRKPWHPSAVAKLIGAAVPKPLPVSGWEMAGSKKTGGRPHPKPTRFAVPAGAVYFWKDGKNKPEEKPLIPKLCQPAEKPIERAAGWGMAFRGIWKYAKPEKIENKTGGEK